MQLQDVALGTQKGYKPMNEWTAARGYTDAGTSKVSAASTDYNVMLEECILGLCLMYVCIKYMWCTSKYDSAFHPGITTYRDLLTVC